FNLTIPLQQLNGLETLVIIMVANKYAFLQITRRRFLNEWEAFKKVISRRNIRRRITIPLTQIGRAVQQECRDRSRMPSSACKKNKSKHYKTSCDRSATNISDNKEKI